MKHTLSTRVAFARRIRTPTWHDLEDDLRSSIFHRFYSSDRVTVVNEDSPGTQDQRAELFMDQPEQMEAVETRLGTGIPPRPSSRRRVHLLQYLAARDVTMSSSQRARILECGTVKG